MGNSISAFTSYNSTYFGSYINPSGLPDHAARAEFFHKLRKNHKDNIEKDVLRVVRDATVRYNIGCFDGQMEIAYPYDKEHYCKRLKEVFGEKLQDCQFFEGKEEEKTRIYYEFPTHE